MLFGEDSIPVTIPPNEAEIRVENVKAKLLQRDAFLKTIADLINNCQNGVNPKTGNAVPVGISIQPISLAGRNTISVAPIARSSRSTV